MAEPAQIPTDEVSAEDRSAILEEIEKVANDNRIVVSVDRLDFTARRAGSGAPLSYR